jgi:hypothetical protein
MAREHPTIDLQFPNQYFALPNFMYGHWTTYGWILKSNRPLVNPRILNQSAKTGTISLRTYDKIMLSFPKQSAAQVVEEFGMAAAAGNPLLAVCATAHLHTRRLSIVETMSALRPRLHITAACENSL